MRANVLERSARANSVGRPPRTQSFECGAGRENVGVGIAPTDDLHSNRQIARGHSGRNRGGWVPSEVDRVSKAPADERIDCLAIDAVWSLGVAVGRIVHGQASEGWCHQQLIAVEHRLEGIVYL